MGLLSWNERLWVFKINALIPADVFNENFTHIVQKSQKSGITDIECIKAEPIEFNASKTGCNHQLESQILLSLILDVFFKYANATAMFLIVSPGFWQKQTAIYGSEMILMGKN